MESTDNKYKDLDVLVIDDDETFRKFLTKLLEVSVNCKVRTATNPNEGFDKINEKLPDLLILDMEMPMKDGYTMLREIRANPRMAKLKVMIVTAIRYDQLIINAAKLNIEAFLIKPPEVNKVVSEVKKALDKVLDEAK